MYKEIGYSSLLKIYTKKGRYDGKKKEGKGGERGGRGEG